MFFDDICFVSSMLSQFLLKDDFPSDTHINVFIFSFRFKMSDCPWESQSKNRIYLFSIFLNCIKIENVKCYVLRKPLYLYQAGSLATDIIRPRYSQQRTLFRGAGSCCAGAQVVVLVPQRKRGPKLKTRFSGVEKVDLKQCNAFFSLKIQTRVHRETESWHRRWVKNDNSFTWFFKNNIFLLLLKHSFNNSHYDNYDTGSPSVVLVSWSC